VWPSPQKAPTSAPAPKRRVRLTMVATATTWSASVACWRPRRRPSATAESAESISERSLGELEEQPGAPGPGDGGGEGPVSEGEIDRGEAETHRERMGEGAREAIARAEVVEEIRERDRSRHRLSPAREHRDGIVDAGEHHEQVHRGPRGGLRPR